MSKTILLVVIGAAVLVVGAIGAVTATVIVNDEGGEARMVQLALAPAPGQALPPFGRRGGRGERAFGPGRGAGPGQLPGMDALRACIQQHGLGNPGTPGATPDLKKMRDALKACRVSLPGRTPLP